ncbi:hypothetical protein TEA_025596 [Camellia sinensis var. sinensis]|uniref:peroxidase n=1 Tax=Camellia sinensis var. sinensis TaxID=542762 RepID=A0A4S4DAI2_CAMSN|nr:hypothetical protein TEA_025596 [Camellia sinensis var. sinensis]
MANTKLLIAFFLHLMLAFSVLDLANAQGLKLGFYKTSCPSAEHIGCEGSVLLNSTKKNQAEKDAFPNLSLRGFQVVDAVKTAVEKKCPGIVSCADILALVARDAVSVINGPSWLVPTGRRDGRISIATDAFKNLPSPAFNITQLKQSFASKGLSVKDLAVLSGGHTIGISHCPSFVNRLYNFTGKGDTDPTMDQNYIAHLKSKCKPTDTTTFVNLSPRSTHKFEPNYYTLVGKRRGLFQSDAALLTDSTTKAYIQLQAASKGSIFMKDFGESMVKMGQIGVLTGKSGDLLMELGAGVELATTAVPHLFLSLACATNVAKVQPFSNVGAVTSTATRTPIYKAFAKGENIGDVTAKGECVGNVVDLGDILEDPTKEPNKDMYMMTIEPEDAPNQPEYVQIGMVSGLPISVSGKEFSPASLLSELNEIGGHII